MKGETSHTNMVNTAGKRVKRSGKESSTSQSRASSSRTSSRSSSGGEPRQKWEAKKTVRGQSSTAALAELEEKEDFVLLPKPKPQMGENAQSTTMALGSAIGSTEGGPVTTPWPEIYQARRVAQRNVVPTLRATGNPEEDWDSFESTIKGYWMGKLSTEQELAGCLRQVKTWANRFKISLAVHDERVLHLIRNIYLKRLTIDPLRAIVVNPLDANEGIFDRLLQRVLRTVAPCWARTAIERRRRFEAGFGKAPKLTYGTSGKAVIDRTGQDCCTEYSKDDADSAKMHSSSKFCYALYERLACKPKTYEKFVSVKGFKPLIARNCAHNEAKAICTRQLACPVEEKEMELDLWDEAYAAFMEWAGPKLEVKEYSNDFKNWVARYPEMRRLALLDAHARLTNRHTEASQTTKAFVKREFVTGKTLDEFKPRLISGKTDEFLVQTGAEFYACDKATNMYLFGPDSDIYCTSGATREQIGAYHSARIAEGAIIVENDFKTFDGSQLPPCLRAYYKFLKRAMAGNEECVETLTKTTKVTGVGMHGHFYSRDGSFDSGRIDTTKGNTVKNAMATWYVYKKLGIRIKIMLIGDDSVVYAYPIAGQQIDVVKIREEFKKLGFDAVAILRPELWDVEYCNQLFWEISPGIYLPGAKPGRMLAKIFHTTKHFKDDEERRQHLRGIVLGEQANFHIPVLGQVFQWILDSIGADGPYKLRFRGDWEFGGNQRYTAGECVYDQFAYRYNLSRATMTHITLPKFEFGVQLSGVFTHIVARDW